MRRKLREMRMCGERMDSKVCLERKRTAKGQTKRAKSQGGKGGRETHTYICVRVCVR